MISLLLSTSAIAADPDSFRLPQYPSTFRQLMSDSWQKFKRTFVDSEGRVREPNANTTSSESASYGLLISVFENDREVFDRIWHWINARLSNQHLPQYGPFAWKIEFGADGSTQKILRESATDADQDIAFALILAYYKWHAEQYREDAQVILDRLWERNTAVVAGKRYLTAGDWATDAKPVRLNPSYFAPYAYRVFAIVDNKHDWMSVVDSCYDVLEKAQQKSRLGLPPDWCDVNPTGEVIVQPFSHDSAFSYDAFRVPWRLAFDANLSGEPRARKRIEQMRFLLDSWKTTRGIKGAYAPTGVATKPEEPLVAIACAMPAIKLIDEQSANEILREKLLARYYDGLWRPQNEIYTNAWAWFGIAAAARELQLPETLQKQLDRKH
jgi:endoglucanase